MRRRGSIIIAVIGLTALWSASAFGKPAPFYYWTSSDAVKGLVRANPQVGFQITRHTTITSATCKGSGAALLRQHRRVYRSFDCMANVHDDEINSDHLYSVSFVTSQSRRGQIGCWGRSHAELVAKHCVAR